MNIKQAKNEVKNAIRAYLAKDEFGGYLIPAIRQRPILLMGPPGIGKTQIMEQIARECGIGLVAYTITHHTRQSAIGLPFIRQKQYGGKEYSITEYTMSEIIASVYDKMESTGLKEGILFIDEINCVSETLAPAMLQFLQCKTFGNKKVPDGWIIVAAGNPAEYNKSVREFDIVTLDRVKKIDVREDFAVWKEYAYQNGIHHAIISYLDLKRECFYQIQTTVDGVSFATARGWEDLSQMIQVYEKLGIPVDQDLIFQYIQHRRIAKDFANYLELYYKYQSDYQVEEVLRGCFDREKVMKLRSVPFDEKLSVISLILARLGSAFQQSYLQDQFVTGLFEELKSLKAAMTEEGAPRPGQVLEAFTQQYHETLKAKKEAQQIDRLEEHSMLQVEKALESYYTVLRAEHLAEPLAAFDRIRSLFQEEVERRSQIIEETSAMLDHAFDFMEAVFPDSQEMVVFITELTVNFYSAKFISENGCDRYYQHNRGLLMNEAEEKIRGQIDEIKENLSAPTLE